MSGRSAGPRSALARELKLTEDDVRAEHLEEINVPAHIAYMLGVVGGATVLMIALMFVLGGTGA